jgi:hypothetical protein
MPKAMEDKLLRLAFLPFVSRRLRAGGKESD